MSRRCELSGKGVLTGNNVSHANNKSRRRYLPNIQPVHMLSESLGRRFRLRVAAATLRSVDHAGGFDAYLLKVDDAKLSQAARRIKRQVEKAQSA